MPPQVALDLSIPYPVSPPLSSYSEESNSSGDSTSSQSSQTSYGSDEDWADFDTCRHQAFAPGIVQKANTFPYLNIEPAKWPHPRRTASVHARPPPLVRSPDRKDQFVNNLVDSAKCMVEVIWPIAACDRHNLSLRTYIQEILKRTKTSFSTLQVALFYLLLIKAHVPMLDFTREQPRDMATVRGFQCGRRMFLAAIILASKYLQDRNYSSKAWSKITSLPVEEINANEMAFLRAIEWKLHITESKFDRWQNILIKYCNPSFVERWKEAVRVLRPELDNLPPLVPQSIRIDTAVAQVASYPSPISPFTPMACSSPGMSPHWVNTPVSERPIPMQPPFAPQIGRLCTPRFNNENMTPICSTPAAGFANTRPAMRSAMSLVANTAGARSVMDCGTVRPFGVIGGVILPPISRSSSSSPESMVSDNSSASRSSSVSSTSSLPVLELNPPRLAQFAQANAFKANILAHGQVTASPEEIIIDNQSRSPSPSAFEHASKKRARMSIDQSYMEFPDDSAMQQQVRSLLRTNAQAQSPISKTAYQKPAVCASVAQLNVAVVGGYRHMAPAAKRLRAENMWRPQGGPGMWESYL